jgi:2-keto-myo-inositol isomerase
MNPFLARRHFFASTAAATLATVALSNTPGSNAQESDDSTHQPVPSKPRFCLNTSTIRGQQLSVPDQFKVAIDAGYDGIEPWLPDLTKFIESGGKLGDLRKQAEDGNLRVESAIGFAKWIVDDEAVRKQGLEDARRDMDILQQIGGLRIAAPPMGAIDAALNLDAAAERYAALLEIGRQMQILPMLELWGFSKTLSKLSELLYVATAAADPDACLLLDVYHLHRGGTPPTSLPLAAGMKVPVLHMNDYPAMPAAASLKDSDRVMPGEGVAPIQAMLRSLQQSGFAGVLSIEIFNEDYWKLPAIDAAKRGLETMQAVANDVWSSM